MFHLHPKNSKNILVLTKDYPWYVPKCTYFVRLFEDTSEHAWDIPKVKTRYISKDIYGLYLEGQEVIIKDVSRTCFIYTPKILRTFWVLTKDYPWYVPKCTYFVRLFEDTSEHAWDIPKVKTRYISKDIYGLYLEHHEVIIKDVSRTCFIYTQKILRTFLVLTKDYPWYIPKCTYFACLFEDTSEHAWDIPKVKTRYISKNIYGLYLEHHEVIIKDVSRTCFIYTQKILRTFLVLTKDYPWYVPKCTYFVCLFEDTSEHAWDIPKVKTRYISKNIYGLYLEHHEVIIKDVSRTCFIYTQKILRTFLVLTKDYPWYVPKCTYFACLFEDTSEHTWDIPKVKTRYISES